METPRLRLVNLLPGQAQKEATINESLHLLDVVVSAAIEEAPRVDPPGTPVAGQSYIVAAGATGDWSGHDGRLAAFTEGGWRFVAPFDGLTALVRSSGETLRYRGGAWERMLAAAQPPIADPVGGATVDGEGRAAIAVMLETLRAHGLIQA